MRVIASGLKRRQLLFIPITVLMASLAGCATTGLFHWGKDKPPVASAENPVIRMLTMWDPGKGPGIDRKTSRGFIGQVLFFTVKSAQPARVNGALRIYLFDDEGSKDEQVKPIHEFYLPPETLAAHYHKTELGATYGIFIPYPKKGLNKVNCSLRARYVPVDEQSGNLNQQAAFFSDMINVSLPGPEPAESPDDSAAQDAARRRKRRPLEPADVEPAVAVLPGKPATSRPDAVPLTEDERARIIAELQAELPLNEPRPLPTKARASRTVAHPQIGADDESDLDEAVETPERLPARTPRAHPLAAEPAEESPDARPRQSFQSRFRDADDDEPPVPDSTPATPNDEAAVEEPASSSTGSPVPTQAATTPADSSSTPSRATTSSKPARARRMAVPLSMASFLGGTQGPADWRQWLTPQTVMIVGAGVVFLARSARSGVRRVTRRRRAADYESDAPAMIA